ncbi:hypothetical protein LCGC14_0534170 [marine sediment metagenome]|uniref:Lipoprotein n=1 Tax=marine sediment metagenome TaxID=412755 RepID=A0A0F9V2U2_9ZZZZ
MNRIILLAITAISLTGCGGSDSDDSDDNEIQYSTTSVQVGVSGLSLQPSQNMYVTFPQIEQFYLEVEACMGVVASGPIVIFTSFSECVEVQGINGPLNCEGLGGNLGQYSIGAQLVLMNTDEHVFDRNHVTDRDTLKHEFVHHLLAEAMNFPIGDNVNHLSPFFGLCT